VRFQDGEGLVDIAGTHGIQEFAMLVGSWSQRVVVGTAAVEEGTYPWEDRAPDLQAVGLCCAFEEEFVEVEIGFNDGIQLTSVGSLFHLAYQAL